MKDFFFSVQFAPVQLLQLQIFVSTKLLTKMASICFKEVHCLHRQVVTSAHVAPGVYWGGDTAGGYEAVHILCSVPRRQIPPGGLA